MSNFEITGLGSDGSSNVTLIEIGPVVAGSPRGEVVVDPDGLGTRFGGSVPPNLGSTIASVAYTLRGNGATAGTVTFSSCSLTRVSKNVYFVKMLSILEGFSNCDTLEFRVPQIMPQTASVWDVALIGMVSFVDTNVPTVFLGTAARNPSSALFVSLTRSDGNAFTAAMTPLQVEANIAVITG